MRRMMGAGLAALVCIGADGALAQNEPPAVAPPPLVAHKALILERLRREAAILQQTANCVQVAANDDGLRLCMQQRRAEEEALRHQGQLR